MAGKEKPYRVYRGGRVKGPIRGSLGPAGGDGGDNGDRGYEFQPPVPAPRRRRRKRRTARIVVVVFLSLVLLAVIWGTLGYLAFRHGLDKAHARLDPRAERALAPVDGSLLSTPANLLVLGTDAGPGRSGNPRSDAIMIVRTDPDHHRIAFLSIPRDLRVEIPGHGPEKVNAAYAFGGSALALTTVRRLTGLPINHIAVVDFSDFDSVIDALGGVTIDVPKRIVSNRFDCPYKSQAECERWNGWHFAPGEQELDGRRALVYARIRENRLDPSDSDITRGGRQQAVMQAIADKAVGLGTFVRLPFMGGDLTKPLTTDLSAGELLELGWVKYRSSTTLRCRLGGEPTQDGYLLGSEDNADVVRMILGQTAPQPPRPGAELFGPGCGT